MATTPPYKLSRAALRERYGSRSADASAPQSDRDDTPSGRQARLRQRGLSENRIEEMENDLWSQRFMPQIGGRMAKATPGVPAMFSTDVPGDVPLIPLGGMGARPVGTGATSSFSAMTRFRKQPRGLPTIQQPEMLAAEPVSGSPLNTPHQSDMEAIMGEQSFFGPKRKPYLGSLMADASQWLA